MTRSRPPHDRLFPLSIPLASVGCGARVAVGRGSVFRVGKSQDVLLVARSMVGGPGTAPRGKRLFTELFTSQFLLLRRDALLTTAPLGLGTY
jgi:hypothetical protein